MTRREKIILAVTGIVAVIGLGTVFWGDKPAPPPPTQAQAGQGAQIAQNALAMAKQATPGKVEAALLAAIDKPWRTGVFYDKSLEPKAGPAKTAALPRFTGYVELGSGRLAVVDGYEYQAGDTLEGGGYKVVSVTPDKVVLESLANGQKLELPYDGLESQGR